MKSLKLGFIIAFCALFLAFPAWAFPEDNLSNRLSGQILLDVENQGAAWYVYPGDMHRYYLGTPADAYNIMRNLSLGISNDNFSKIVSSTPDRFNGLILLKTEDVGRAYYVNPSDKSINYMPDAAAAFALMSNLSLGITNKDLKTIPEGKIILNEAGQEISRTWQYLGWWGRVNTNYVPVLSVPAKDAKKIGTFFTGNKIKVLEIKKGDGRIWYRVDGGEHPGGYVDAIFVNAIAQPAPENKLIIPPAVKSGDYWIDVNIAKKVLVLYKYDQVIMATYIAVGDAKSPTIIGTYNVWFKAEKIRMRGAPPLATHEYDLPNVPWTMFYKGSFSIHGTYWHDDFGTQRSAGCTNITQGDAKFLFDTTGPDMKGLSSIYSSASNPGVLIRNHY